MSPTNPFFSDDDMHPLVQVDFPVADGPRIDNGPPRRDSHGGGKL